MSASITDFTQFSELRASADRQDPEALREVAGQFEALFLQMMLKNMRAASFGDSLMGDNKQQEMYRDMMDQQLSLDMASGKGIGLADMLVRQMGGDPGPVTRIQPNLPTPAPTSPVSGLGNDGRQVSTPIAAETAASFIAGSTPAPPPASMAAVVPREPEKAEWSDPESFAQTVWPHVNRAAKALNVSPVGVLAQAALETGWGSKVMQTPDGGSSFNLFGIKAANGWSGDSVKKPTLEFENGVARRETATFRAYDNLGKTLDDYAAFLQDNPRYERVKNTGDDIEAFAGALADGGYATDPNYAKKITEIFHGPTMRRVLGSLPNAAGIGR